MAFIDSSIRAAFCLSCMCALRFKHLYFLNQPNEGKWKKKYTFTSWYLLYRSFVLYYNKMEFLDQKASFVGIGRTVPN